MKSSIVLCLSLINFCFVAESYAQWVPAHGPYGGSVDCFAVDGTRLLAGGMYGIFLSTNFGGSWQVLTKNRAEALAVGADGKGGIILFSANYGVSRSIDYGRSWTPVANFVSTQFERGYVSKIAVHGRNLFAVADPITFPGGLFLSTNNGESWARVTGDQPKRLPFAKSGTKLLGTGNGLFLSTDDGTSWARMSTDLPDGTWWFPRSAGGARLFAISSKGLYHSTDEGLHWAKIGSQFSGGSISDVLAFGTDLFVCMLNGEQDGGGIFVSKDEGTSWMPATAGLIKGGSSSILAVCGPNLFASTSAGVYRWSSESSSWISVNTGLRNLLIGDLAVSGTRVFAGVRGGGVAMSTDRGVNWTYLNDGLKDPWVSTLTMHKNACYAGGGYSISVSSNNGGFWQQTLSLDTALINALLSSGTDLFAGCEGPGYVYRSTDDGLSWAPANVGLPNAPVKALAATPTHLYAGTQGEGVYSSTDRGGTWVRTASGATGWISCMLAQGTNLFVGSSYGEGIFMSTNNGASWISRKYGFPDRYDAYYPRDLAWYDSYLFAATDGGVFLSTDNGDRWVEWSDGLSVTHVTRIAVSPTTVYVEAAGSVWQRPICQTELPTRFGIFQNYPNPFNSSTTIRYGLPLSAETTVSVYSVLGQLVTVLVNEPQESGYHETTFDASSLASGVYFYRLQAGSYVDTKKLLLLR